MKKAVFIVIMMVLSVFGVAEDSASWLQVEWAFQLGWIPQGAIAFYKPEGSVQFVSYEASFNISFIFLNMLNIGGKANSMFESTQYIDSYFPTGITYSFYCGFSPLPGMSFNYEHSCSHPIAVYEKKNDGYPFLDSGYDRIYIEIKGKLSY